MPVRLCVLLGLNFSSLLRGHSYESCMQLKNTNNRTARFTVTELGIFNNLMNSIDPESVVHHHYYIYSIMINGSFWQAKYKLIFTLAPYTNHC